MKSVLGTGAMVLLAFGAGAADAPRLLAHRGGAKEFDENSRGSFRASYEKGLRGFETDISPYPRQVARRPAERGDRLKHALASACETRACLFGEAPG